MPGNPALTGIRLQTKGFLAAGIVTLIFAGLMTIVFPKLSCAECRPVAGGGGIVYDRSAGTDDPTSEGATTEFEPATLGAAPSANDNLDPGRIFADEETLTVYPVLNNAIEGAYQDIRSAKGRLFFKQFQTRVSSDTEARVEVRVLKLIEGAYGGYRKGTSIIVVDRALVEQASRGDKKAQENLEATIVHEFAHWVDAEIKAGSDTPGEEGKAAERAIYGYDKNLSNVKGQPNRPYDPGSN